MNVKEHNLKAVGMFDDIGVKCACGGNMRGIGKGGVGRTYAVCDKCLSEQTVYVATSEQVDDYNGKGE